MNLYQSPQNDQDQSESIKQKHCFENFLTKNVISCAPCELFSHVIIFVWTLIFVACGYIICFVLQGCCFKNFFSLKTNKIAIFLLLLFFAEFDFYWMILYGSFCTEFANALFFNFFIWKSTKNAICLLLCCFSSFSSLKINKKCYLFITTPFSFKTFNLVAPSLYLF
jgi:hypothetical protein